MGGLNVTLGAEQSFFTHHSVNIGAFHYGTQDHHDDSNFNDTIDDSKHRYTANHAFYFVYRYYFGRDLSAAKKFSLYTGITGRYGEKRNTADPDFGQNIPTYEKVNYLGAGPLFGVVVRLGNRVNLDVYGAAMAASFDSRVSFKTKSGVELTTLRKYTNLLPVLGLDLSFWFGW